MEVFKKCIEVVERPLALLDRGFNRVYGSEYNPIYRSGTLAVLLLAMAIVSGLILIFFYRVGGPYESVMVLEQSWAGRWLRSFHRYASDAMVVAVIFHAFRMWAQEKTWGKRTLPWVTGVILLLMTVASAWSGFIMVWDSQAQALTLALARAVDAMGILGAPMSQGFDGASARPERSFFFFVVFFHVVIPLGMIFGVWVHTMKLARATWFPNKKIIWLVTLSLALFSILVSAPVGEEANLLAPASQYPLNLWYLFWLPWSENSPGMAALLGGIAVLLFFLVPAFVKPRPERQPPPSTLDEDVCNGCNQCVEDCPYEAISLIDRLDTKGGRLSEKRALVNPDQCVSCTLCSASCPVFTIGPKGRNALDQHRSANAFLKRIRSDQEELEPHEAKVVVVSCSKQPYTARKLKELEANYPHVKVFPIECMGTLHMRTIGQMAGQADQIILAACPERNCSNKDAHMLLRERKNRERAPLLPERVDPSKVKLIPVGDGEHEKVERLILGENGECSVAREALKKTLPFFASFGLLCLLAFASAMNYTVSGADKGVARLSWKLQSQKVSHCIEPDEAMQSSLAHMRPLEECVSSYPDYRLLVTVDGEPLMDKIVSHSGLSGKSPLYVYESIELAPGQVRLRVRFAPKESGIEEGEGPLAQFDQEFNLSIERDKRVLIHLGSDGELTSKYHDE